MRVLVTGGTGFTGKALVRRMIESGHEVLALDCKEGHRSSEISEWGARLVLGSITDRELVDRCMAGIDVVHHVAAAFRDTAAPDSHYHWVNVHGTEVLLAAALRHRVKRFIYCSTCGVHGDVRTPPADETTPINPADFYQKSKFDAEPLVLQAVERGLSATILRPAAIFGPGDLGRYLLIFRQLQRGWFPMFGSGEVLYHPLFIDNLLDAFECAMVPDRGLGEAYLIADDRFLSIRQLVEEAAAVMNVQPRIRYLPLWPLVVASHVVPALCRPFGLAPPLSPRRLEWYTLNRAFDISKARRDLDYRPRVALDEGLRRTWDWYVKEGLV